LNPPPRRTFLGPFRALRERSPNANCPLRRAELLEPVAVGPDEFEDAAAEFGRSV
jgi:hypothetical protein